MAVTNRPFFAVAVFLTGMGVLLHIILGNEDKAILYLIANLIASLGAYSR